MSTHLCLTNYEAHNSFEMNMDNEYMTGLDWYQNQKWFRCDFATYCKYVFLKNVQVFSMCHCLIACNGP